MTQAYIFSAILVSSTLLTSCSLSRPCSEAGDTSWNPPLSESVRGNRQCHQARQKDGKYLNHGQYLEWYRNGNIAIRGDFKEGKKDGIWTQYDEKGSKIMERNFRDGVEISR